MHRPPKPPPKPTRDEAITTAALAFARLCDRTNTGGLTEDEARHVLHVMERSTRDLARTITD